LPEAEAGSGVVVPRPAATVVLVRPGPRGLEVLLTRRPSTMAFGPGLHVFPGGAVDPTDADVGDDPHAAAAVRELSEEVGIRLAPEALIPLSRWVTPPGSSRRYDTRFFVAGLPSGATVAADPREVAGHRWITPGDALDEMAAGAIDLWPPTSITLQQLAPAHDLDDVRRYLAPVIGWPAPVAAIEAVSDAVTRVTFGGAGGIPGQTVDGYLVGRRRVVIVDPGDPSDEAADAIARVLDDRRAELSAILLTAPVPDHAAGAEALAIRHGIPILASAGAASVMSSEIVSIEDRDLLGFADVEMRVHATPGTDPDHLAFSLPGEDAVLVGDLEGPGPSRAVPAPVDEAALSRSRALVEGLGGLRLGAHR
jgi:8-oxo-dGTP pyrophosphatase MutT (NUDIX family)/glyoxylase-like metal-dependent hydrolase (beta-lactamase superfamily II)